MKKLLLLFMMMLPLAAAAQYFTPDLPEDKGLYVFVNPSMIGMHTEWVIMPGEKVLVEEVRDNGWCQIKYVSKKGNEFAGHIKMERLKPLDDIAAGMKEAAVKRAAREKQLIAWGGILLAVGLVVSFMKFLGVVRTMLLYIVAMLLSALEIWFLTQTEGFTFYLPAVVGWKWAAILFTAFMVFIAGQMIIFYKTLMFFERTRGVFAMPVVLVCLSALGALVAAMLSLFWPSLEQYIGTGMMVAIAVCTVYLFINVLIKDGILNALLATPLFAVGIAAILLMLVDAVIAFICGAGLFIFFQSLLGGGGGGKTILDDMGSKKRGIQEDIMARQRAGQDINSSPLQ